ncbi:hypothetical protein shim_19190 [Shimia sp. SK013]|uniref:hypothetical protein n=1 Tax=Shimia sp. SK013 TaxID=1389006 RepID=UPI0006B4DB5A|nr:hypothetical protein [Shimia sp. SK013]KPA22032.1 hypothetical protein shim_19190 [Shimia sp. SK013]
MTRIFKLLACFVVLALTACAVPKAAQTPDVDGLRRALVAMGDFVAADEADTVARLSYAYSLQLRAEYQVSDPPLVHNAKVNKGRKPRGLCWHWADDLEARLRSEDLQTFSLYRAIANSDNLRIEHSTVILAERGAPMETGVVLDPWRYGGYLFWAPVAEDTRYRWKSRAQVFLDKRN